jgi:hypothetical protein
MKVFIDHNNLKDFMNVKTLSERQVKWAMRLISFDFIIKHRFEKINLVDDSSRRFDYHDVNTKITRLLLILQTKFRIVVFLHIQFSSVRAIIVALSAKISRIVSDEDEISRSKIATFAFISVLSEKRRECDELTQCVLRAIIAILSENETFYEIISNLSWISSRLYKRRMSSYKHVLKTSKRQTNVNVMFLSNQIILWKMIFWNFENVITSLRKNS